MSRTRFESRTAAIGFGGLALLGAIAVVLDHAVVLDLYSNASSLLQRVNRLISKLLDLASTSFLAILIFLSRSLIDLDIPSSFAAATGSNTIRTCILAMISTPTRCFSLP